jgi:gentisate 1,2-dioxygenase
MNSSTDAARIPHPWEKDLRFFEYTSAANPRLPKIPIDVFPASAHQSGSTRIIGFDLSSKIGTSFAATTPSLMASYLRILPGESLATEATATSQMFYVIRGCGSTEGSFGNLRWSEGDLFVVPLGERLKHQGSADSAVYWVHDEPLLRYLGVAPTEARFQPTLFTKSRLMEELDAVRSQPGASGRNRMGILLGNTATPQTLTLTHILWSLLNVLPAGIVQKPHRHNSVAIDLCVAAAPGTYTLIGDSLDTNGNILEPVRADWIPGSVFVTPPGLWHSHHNDSDQDAMVLPIQDAGLHTFLRTLDIQFVK